MDLYRKRNPDTFESNPKYQRAEDRLLEELEKDLSLDDKENVVTNDTVMIFTRKS